MAKIKIKKNHPSIGYPSSLIQQNHRETPENHGLFVWDLDTLKHEEVDIFNDYGYYTLHVQDGELLDWDEARVPLKPRIQIYYYNTNLADQKIIESFIKSKRKVIEWKINVSKAKKDSDLDLQKFLNLNIRNVEYQNQLIEEFLRNSDISSELLDLVKDINKDQNTKLVDQTSEKSIRNILWRPLSFTFSNMFSYGENNFIDFSSMDGIYGIFGPNATGKSTVFDAFCFCLFDKCSKTYRARDVLNKEKSTFSSKVEFEINDVVYTVEKIGKKTSSGNVKVDINFFCKKENGEIVSLNGDQRDSTTKNIRNYIGSYEDFILTSLSVQNNGTNFIEKPQRERRELLINFLDLGVYESLSSQASEQIKEIKAQLKVLQNLNLEIKLQEVLALEESLSLERDSIQNELLLKKEVLESKIKEREALILQIKPLEALPPLEEVDRQLILSQKTLDDVVQNLNKLLTDTTIEEGLEKIQIEINSLPTHIELDSRIKRVLKLKEIQTSFETELRVCFTKINNALDHISKLDSHEYDPNCDFCAKHPVVTNGVLSRTVLEELQTEKTDFESKLKQIEKEVEILSSSNRQLDLLRKLEAEKLQYENDKKLKEKTLESLEREKIYTEKIFNETLSLKEKINRVADNIDFNNRINKEINELDFTIKNFKSKIEDLNYKFLKNSNEISVAAASIKNCEEGFKDLQRISLQLDAYDLYMQCVKSDGVPYRLIDKILPLIEEEVNNILLGIVDFKLNFETDNKNINAYITYEDGKNWPIEAGSGMEKFLSSLAIRTSLISCTSLPKPNFICIDEGFGVLDVDNLSNVGILFSKMKENFDTLFCISHIDEMRDIVDKFIFINKSNGFSTISLD